MKIKQILLSTIFLMSITVAHAEDVKPYYFDLLTINEKSELASNFINNQIREIGGLERVKDGQKAGDDMSSMILGYLYLEGHVYEKDVDLGIKILSRASRTGSYSSFILGKHFLDLKGEFNYSHDIKKDGADLIEFAAMNGIAEAEYLAGIFYISGQYYTEDRDIGMILIKSASYKGHSPSRKFLSEIDSIYYQQKLDFDKIQKMATEGNIDALIELALMYKEGWKVNRNIPKAKRLLEVAQAKGSEKATQMLHKFK